MRRLLVLSLLLGGALGGCGSASPSELPPAAEPPRSPAPRVAPAGTIVRVGHRPEGIVADPLTGVVAVGLHEPDGLALLDGRRLRLLRRIPLTGAPRHLELERPGGPVLVPAEPAGAVIRVPLPRGRPVSEVRVGRQPHDLTVARGLVFAGNELGNSVSVLDADRVTRTFPVALQPGGLAAVEKGSRVAVVSVRERVLELFDSKSLRRTDRVPAGVGPTHIACLDAGPCYVTDTSGDGLLVYTLRPRVDLVRRVRLPGGPYGIALDSARARLWVTLPGANRLVELPAHGRPHVLRTFPTVQQPDTVAVDRTTGRVFVTGKIAGVVQVIDP